MKIKFNVENLKCSGCANSIKKGVMKLPGVSTVEVDIDHDFVSVLSDSRTSLEDVISMMDKLGYPMAGFSTGMDAKRKKLKSYISCAVGKLAD